MKSIRFGVMVGIAVVTTTASVATAASSSGAAGKAAPRTASSAATSLKGVDRALGNGLGRLLAQSGTSGQGGSLATGGLRIDQNKLSIRDRSGRVLVDLTPRTGVDRAAFRRAAEARGLSVRSTDAAQGTLEGFAALSAIRGLAGMAGTGTIAQALKPVTQIGAATSQGVAFQRVDRVQAKGIKGQGMTIGALSDSYNTATTDIFGAPLTIHAADDVRSGDLPGTGNSQNSQPVVVVQDDPNGAVGGAFDEGRAMLQIAHDVAPKAKLCFATADAGEVGFADNIRRLGDKNGPCRADVEVDDVFYPDEPYFSDGPISDAVDDVAKQGVSYFSSAGNQGDHNGWQSRVHLVPAAQGLAGTNLDFSQVDPALYSGGLQDMNPGPGVDVAQSLTLGDGGGLFDLQWDDPVDINGAQLGDAYFTATGNITTADPAPSFTFTPTASELGKQVRFNTDAIPSGTTDLILDVTKPDGTELGPIDTGASPESLVTVLDQAGAYKITITGFAGATGDFTIDVRPIIAPSKTTTDFNVLLFAPNGAFLGALADANTLSGRPSEIAQLAGLPGIQIAISRAGTGPVGATTLRLVTTDELYISEYSDPLSPTMIGHDTAKGAISVAAYDAFRPYLPEYFTSPGGFLPFYFDSAGNRYPHPQIRQVPQLSSTDGGNTTFFTSDTARDPDTQPNFFGTSAAAPHAASIAALLLQKAGGRRSLTPAQVLRRLEKTTFVHDLDPDRASGSARGLTITASGPQGSENDAIPGSMADTKFFTLRNTGSSRLRSVTFYGESASPTALGLRHPPLSDGIVFDPRALGASPFRASGFPFTIGSTSGGLSPSSVTASFSVPGGGTAVAGQFRHMTLTFAQGLARGQALQFGVDRDLQVSGLPAAPNEGNGADELGGATFMPQRITVPFGLAFSAKRSDGRTIWGVITNKLGHGWTPLDGYGMVDAERAVLGR